jgi:hypothetical protein
MNKQRINAALLALNFLLFFAVWATAQITVPAGLPVTLEVPQTLRSGEVTTGQEIALKVREDVLVDNVVVIRAGSPAQGRIIMADPELLGEVRVFIEPFACLTTEGFEVILGGPATVFDKEEDRTEVIIHQGTVVMAEIYNEFTVQAPPPADPEPETPAAPAEQQTEEPVVATDQKSWLLPAGTEVELVISDEVVVSELEQGDPIRLRVKTDVKWSETVVIRAKAPAEGFVKRISGNRVYVMASNVTAADGNKLLLESDRSTVVTLDETQLEEPQPLSGEMKAMLANESRVSGR